MAGFAVLVGSGVTADGSVGSIVGKSLAGAVLGASRLAGTTEATGEAAID